MIRRGIQYFALLSVVLTLTDTSHSAPLSSGESTENGNPDFKVTRIAGPFEYPWSIGFLPGGGILVTERPGRLQYVEAGRRLAIPIDGVPPVVTGEQAGLMDVVVDPDFVHNQTIYLSYAHGTDDLSTVRVLKASLDLDKKTLAHQEVIFEAQPYAVELINYGGRLALDAKRLSVFDVGRSLREPARSRSRR
jgi:glucose/arabinose dehydrogenase